MLTTFGAVSCFKAYNAPAESAQLDFDRLRRNMAGGVQTQLMLDANVLIDMTDCCKEDAPDDDSILYTKGLLEWVLFLRDCTRQGLQYYLSPFFALQELPVEKIDAAALAIDLFPRKFGLSWVDDEASEAPELAYVGRRVSRRRFEGMRDSERRMFSPSYAGLLLMLTVARDSRDRPPFIAFMRFVRLYRRRTDAISMRMIAIARMVFAPPPNPGSTLRPMWESIVFNFTQRKSLAQRLPRTLHHMDKAADNGAHDLMLLDAALVAEAKGLEGQRLDPWIVTRDKKLSVMGELFHHGGSDRTESGRYLQVAPLAHHGDYWARTDEVMVELGRAGREDVEFSWDRAEQRALGIIALAENGLDGGTDVDDQLYQHTQILTSGGGRSS